MYINLNSYRELIKRNIIKVLNNIKVIRKDKDIIYINKVDKVRGFK